MTRHACVALLALTAALPPLSAQQPFVFTTGVAPDAIDYRPLLYAAKNQLYRGSCTAFATVAALEYFPGVPRLSEAYLYAIVKDGDFEFDGSTLTRLKQVLDSVPMLSEERLRYDNFGAFGFNEHEPQEAQMARLVNRVKGRQAQQMRPYAIYQAYGTEVRDAPAVTLDWVKTTLATVGPVVATFRMNSQQWLAALNDPQHAEIDEMVMVDAQGHLLGALKDDGGHAVLLVGYRKDGWLIFRNSWGPEWGDQGYGYMSPAYFASHLMQAMVVHGVVTHPNFGGQGLIQFEVRANAEETSFDRYTVFLSFVLQSPFMSGGGVDSVRYTLYPPTPEQGTMPLMSVTARQPTMGMLATIAEFPYHSFKVYAEVFHPAGGVTSGWRDIPEAITWSAAPITH